jgi:hypothetical protein
MIWETIKEQRRTLRRPIGHIGTILTEPDASPRLCIVMDESDGGVRISIPMSLNCPTNLFCVAIQAQKLDTKWSGATAA